MIRSLIFYESPILVILIDFLTQICLQEGENNDKFSHHPRSFDALPAYLLVHNKWFNIGDLCAAVVLLCLGFVEEPCMTIFRVPVQG